MKRKKIKAMKVKQNVKAFGKKVALGEANPNRT